jgi:hypothetical protein
MGYGKVSKVQITDSTITLSVDLDGFDPGTLVEISGNATQDNGAVTTFYAVQAIPAGSSEEVTLPVVSPVQPNTFKADSPVTVVARAAAVWINTLNPDTSQAMVWKLNSYGPALYLPPQ